MTTQCPFCGTTEHRTKQIGKDRLGKRMIWYTSDHKCTALKQAIKDNRLIQKVL